MTSYLSSLLTTTTSRLGTLRSNLLSSETDGETEDDTHLCRVLRAYYTEKARPFPGWLPPDPKAPPPPVVTPMYSQPGVGSRYGGGGVASGGSLSSLWDSQPQQGGAQPEGSLRAGRGVRGGQAQGIGRQNPFLRENAGQQEQSQVQARPLPSQRAGSYQSTGLSGGGRDSPAGGLSASEKLRSRFKPGAGGRSNSPASPQSGRMADVARAAVRQNSFGREGSGGGGGNYEDRFMPGNSGGGNYGGGGEKPFVAATSPWASNESEFSGGYGGSGGGAPRQGLPSGPGAGRRMGLPSGPRGQR